MRPSTLARTAAVAVALLAVSACSNGSDADKAPVAASGPRLLADVDLDQPLRVLGTEPFWSVEVTPDALVYSDVENNSRRAANPGPVLQGTTAEYQARDDRDQPVILTLMATECSDGMSDRTYPLTARLVLGEQTLNGCAASTDWLARTNEQGETAPAA